MGQFLFTIGVFVSLHYNKVADHEKEPYKHLAKRVVRAPSICG